MTNIEAKRIRRVIEQAMSKEEDTVVLENANLLPKWEPKVNYESGRKLVYNGTVYKVLQTHISQPGWEPDVAVSVFAKVLIPDPEVIPVWERPGSTNPYMKGNKVHYPTIDDPVYESKIDNNVWSPDEYPDGWNMLAG